MVRNISFKAVLILLFLAQPLWPCVDGVKEAGESDPGAEAVVEEFDEASLSPEVWPAEFTEAQTLFLDRAIAKFSSTGKVMTDENCYSLFQLKREQVVGLGRYAPDGDRAHLAIFLSPFHFWASFDRYVQRELGILAQKWNSAPLDPDDRQAYAKLFRFNIFLVRLISDDKRYPKPFLEYMAQRREPVLTRLAAIAVEHFQKTGILVNGKNCKTILDITWKQLMGMDYHAGRAASGVGGFRRMTGNRAGFWKLFDVEVLRRLEKFEGKPDYLKTFSIYQVAFEPRSRSKREKESEIPADLITLFDAHRPREKLRYAALIVDALQRKGEMVNQDNCSTLLPKMNWKRLVALSKYSVGQPTYYRRIFENMFEMYALVDAEREARLTRWPLPAISKGAEGRQNEEERLLSVNFLDLPRPPFYRKGRTVPPDIEQIFTAHRTLRANAAIQTVTRAIGSGTILNKGNCRSLLNIEFDQLIGRDVYQMEKGRAARWRYFDTIDQFAAALNFEIARQLLQLRADHLLDTPFAQNLNAFEIIRWLRENRPAR